MLRFAHAVDGLAARNGEELTGFTVAGAERKFVWADARIEGDTVVIGAKKVAEPVAVRYGWAINPRGNLVDGAGLPCVPFRSDDWPLEAADRP